MPIFLFLLILVVIVIAVLGFGLLFLILSVLGGGRGNAAMSDAETREIQELHRVLETMEQRIERLEEELYRRMKRDA